jgi:hypothetical protein
LKNLILFVAILSASSALAESLHITAIHKATRDEEKTYHTAFNQNIITGTIGNKRYTMEQLVSWGFYHFEVGKDYPVVKTSDKEIKVQVTGKKGHESTERLNVVTIEEMEAEK